ncbi:MAG: Xaa-Pro peptidase family protein [Planctomycetota bacterium]|nr:Xaa-Pro peptidase family protein [Planctomycetota bacterium]
MRPIVYAILALLSACATAKESPVKAEESLPVRWTYRPASEQRFFDWTETQFHPDVHRARRARLTELLRASGGGVFVTPSRSGVSHGGTFRQLDEFLYLTGLELPDSVLAIDADRGQTILFVPARDARFENPTRPNDYPGRPLADDPELSLVSGIDDVRPYDQLEAALDSCEARGRKLRVNPGQDGPPGLIGPIATSLVDSLTPAQALILHLQREHPSLLLASCYADVARLRMIKGPEEIELIRRACAITCAGIRAAAARVAAGVDERTLEGELEAAFKRGGAQRPAFDSIVKSGPNSLWPWRILAAHYDRRNRVMLDGELVIFDVGCEVDHYASDVGRTFPVSGAFTLEQEAALRVSTTAADAVIAAVRPGVTLAELQAVAEAAIREDERAYMQTDLFFGHHIGLNVGDPWLADEPLQPGMVFTVEPWYYDHAREMAVFVEDVVLVTESGCENLTADLPRGPRELEALVRPPDG